MIVDRRTALGVIAGAPFGVRAAFADVYPSRILRLVVPYPAGGPTDVYGRYIANQLGTAFGQNMIVENISGASGVIGTRVVLKAPPDGYTLLLGSYQTHATVVPLMPDLGYDPVKDFIPVAGIGGNQHVLVVSNELPVKSVKELIDYGRAHPGKLNYGSTGNGSLSQLGMELFKTRTGLDMVHVPFSGSAPLVLELTAGRIDLAFAVVSAVLEQVRGGNMRALGVASSSRAPQFPDLPRLDEQGVVGSEADSWLGIWVAKGVPAPIVERLENEIRTILRKPATIEKGLTSGFLVEDRSGRDLGELVKSEITRWSDAIRLSGTKGG